MLVLKIILAINNFLERKLCKFQIDVIVAQVEQCLMRISADNNFCGQFVL